MAWSPPTQRTTAPQPTQMAPQHSRRMRTTRGGCTPRALIIPTLVILGCGVLLLAQDRIYLDQYSPLRSELMIADADGKNPRKLLPGSQLDYNASFSFDGQWVVFTSERNGSADIFRARSDGTGVERLTDS